MTVAEVPQKTVKGRLAKLGVDLLALLLHYLITGFILWLLGNAPFNADWEALPWGVATFVTYAPGVTWFVSAEMAGKKDLAGAVRLHRRAIVTMSSISSTILLISALVT